MDTRTRGDAPVIVDDVKRDPADPDSVWLTWRREITRCVYLSLEHAGDELAAASTGPVPGMVDVAVADFAAVIVGAPGGGEFSSADKLEELYHRVEQAEGWLIELPELWLPTERILAAKPGAGYGTVLRADLRLLEAALAFTRGRLSRVEYLERAKDEAWGPLRWSPEETRAFAEWGEREIEEARREFEVRLKEKKVVPWQDEKGRLMLGKEPLEGFDVREGL